MSVLRNLVRRRLRTLLTVLGVGIAVFGLVVLGALSERMRLHVENGDRYYGDYAWVVQRASFFGIGGRVESSLQAEIEEIPGVEYAASRVFVVPIDDDDMLSATPWNMSALVGLDLDERRCIIRDMRLLDGRQMEVGARGEAVLGYAAAEKYELGPGDTLEVRKLKLEVVGVLDMIGADPDHAVFTSIADARLAAPQLGPEDVSAFAVKLSAGADEDAVSAAIEETSDDELRAIMPAEIKTQVSATTVLINSLLYGCTIIAVIVGTLGTANTMTMSVGERAREIATKKAIGASTADIFKEFLLEAVLISAFGAIIGVAAGLVGVQVLNRVIPSPGLPLFVITARLLLVGGAVALTVGGLAGVFPALQAARVDPVRILRNA